MLYCRIKRHCAVLFLSVITKYYIMCSDITATTWGQQPGVLNQCDFRFFTAPKWYSSNLTLKVKDDEDLIMNK